MVGQALVSTDPTEPTAQFRLARQSAAAMFDPCPVHPSSTQAETKGYVERFLFRAPPAGTGPLTFRVLIKQGDTNRGAFYWPNGGAPPRPGVAGGDLVLSEAQTSKEQLWFRGLPGATCREVCRAIATRSATMRS